MFHWCLLSGVNYLMCKAVGMWWVSIIKDTVQFRTFFAHSMQFWIGFRKLPLKMNLKQEFSFYSLFALAPYLFGRSARKSCAFCTGATTSVAPPLRQVHFRLVYSWRIKLQCASITSHSHLHTHKFHLINIHRNALSVRVAQQMSLR